jgi:hypothetical protein
MAAISHQPLPYSAFRSYWITWAGKAGARQQEMPPTLRMVDKTLPDMAEASGFRPDCYTGVIGDPKQNTAALRQPV